MHKEWVVGSGLVLVMVRGRWWDSLHFVEEVGPKLLLLLHVFTVFTFFMLHVFTVGH